MMFYIFPMNRTALYLGGGATSLSGWCQLKHSIPKSFQFVLWVSGFVFCIVPFAGFNRPDNEISLAIASRCTILFMSLRCDQGYVGLRMPEYCNYGPMRLESHLTYLLTYLDTS